MAMSLQASQLICKGVGALKAEKRVARSAPSITITSKKMSVSKDHVVKVLKDSLLLSAGIGAVALAAHEPALAMIHETANGGWNDTLDIHTTWDSLPHSGLDLRPYCGDPYCPGGDPFQQPGIYPAIFGWALPQGLATAYKAKQAEEATALAVERGIDLDAIMEGDEMMRSFNGLSDLAKVGKLKGLLNLMEVQAAAEEAGIPKSTFADIDTSDRNNNWKFVQYKKVLVAEGVEIPPLSLRSGAEAWLVLAPVAFVILVCINGLVQQQAAGMFLGA